VPSFGRQKINLSTVFAGQNVGVKQVADQVWLISFMDYDLGFFELGPMLEQSPPNMEEVIAAFARHKSELLITPPAAGTTKGPQ
jgi:hypothetical protein